jgi:hypothetical protein
MLQAATAIEITVEAELVVRAPNVMVKNAIEEPETGRFLGEVLEGLGLTGGRVVLEGAAPREDPAPKPATTPSAKPATKPSAKPETAPSAKPETRPSAKPATPRAQSATGPPAGPDTRSMGQIFKDEPILQKALDMFDGEVLP